MIGRFFPSLLITDEDEAYEFANEIGAEVEEYYYSEKLQPVFDENPKFMGWVLIKDGEVVK